MPLSANAAVRSGLFHLAYWLYVHTIISSRLQSVRGEERDARVLAIVWCPIRSHSSLCTAVLHAHLQDELGRCTLVTGPSQISTKCNIESKSQPVVLPCGHLASESIRGSAPTLHATWNIGPRSCQLGAVLVAADNAFGAYFDTL